MRARERERERERERDRERACVCTYRLIPWWVASLSSAVVGRLRHISVSAVVGREVRLWLCGTGVSGKGGICIGESYIYIYIYIYPERVASVSVNPIFIYI